MQTNIHSFGVSKFVFQNLDAPHPGSAEAKKEVVVGIEDPVMKASRELEGLAKEVETETFREAASVARLHEIADEFDKARQILESNKDGLRVLIGTEVAVRKAIIGSTPSNQAERGIILDHIEELMTYNPELFGKESLAKRKRELESMTFEEEEKEGASIEHPSMDATTELEVIYRTLTSFRNGDFSADDEGRNVNAEYVPGTKFPAQVTAVSPLLKYVAGEFGEPRNNAEKQTVLKYLDARLAGQDEAYIKAYKDLGKEGRSEDVSIGRYEESRLERQDRLLARKQHVESLVFSK